MKNSSQADSAMQIRETAQREKESAANESITTLNLVHTAAASGSTALNYGTNSACLQAYKECIGDEITERTEDASYMQPESVMMQSKEQWSNSGNRNGSNLTNQNIVIKKKTEVSAFEDQVKPN